MMGALGRQPPPDIPVGTILHRWRYERFRNLVLGGVGLAAGLLALVFLRPPPEEPPVHLHLRIVDVSPEESPDGVLTSFESTPAELNRP